MPLPAKKLDPGFRVFVVNGELIGIKWDSPLSLAELESLLAEAMETRWGKGYLYPTATSDRYMYLEKRLGQETPSSKIVFEKDKDRPPIEGSGWKDSGTG